MKGHPSLAVLVALVFGGCSAKPSGPKSLAHFRGDSITDKESYLCDGFPKGTSFKDADDRLTRYAMFHNIKRIYSSSNGRYVISDSKKTLVGYNASPLVPIWISAEVSVGNVMDHLAQFADQDIRAFSAPAASIEVKPIAGFVNPNGKLLLKLPEGWFRLDEKIGAVPHSLDETVSQKGTPDALCSIEWAQSIEKSSVLKYARLHAAKPVGRMSSLQTDRGEKAGFALKIQGGFLILRMIDKSAEKLDAVKSLANAFESQGS